MKPGSVHEILRVEPVINCCGIYTDLGGSILSDSVMRAMVELNQSYVKMVDLLDSTGVIIADIVGAEAARVTPSCSAALALSVAATMTRNDGRRWEQLPDTTGMKNNVLIARVHLDSYKYIQPVRLSGCQVQAIGRDDVYDQNALIAAIDEQTACILVPAHLLDGFAGADRLRELCSEAHRADIPVVVDAAYLSYPLELLRSFAAAGADLTCFSAKYFFGPNSGGFVSGSRTLIEAVEGLDFTRFESGLYRSFGRSFKMSRYDVAATALALQEWVETDHHQRWRRYAEQVEVLASAVRSTGLEYASVPCQFTLDERIETGGQVNALQIDFPPGSDLAKRTAADLESGSPSIMSIVMGDMLILAVDATQPGEETLIGLRLAQSLKNVSQKAGQ